MEADWAVEIGPGAPVIDALWTGLVDLRQFPERVGDLEEARRFPALAEALLRLNGAEFWTSKCDLWPMDADTNACDPDEMDADIANCVAGVACYIDLLPRDWVAFAELDRAEKCIRDRVERMRQMAPRCCRADLVIRRAFAGEQEGLGVTAYLSACGANGKAAEKALSCALGVLVSAVNEAT